MKDGKYCMIENDGISLCVCKHRPCQTLKDLKEHCKKIDEVNKNLYSEKVNLLEENKRLKENKIKELDRALTAENIYKQTLEEIKNKLDIVMTKDFTRLGEWEPFFTYRSM